MLVERNAQVIQERRTGHDMVRAADQIARLATTFEQFDQRADMIRHAALDIGQDIVLDVEDQAFRLRADQAFKAGRAEWRDPFENVDQIVAANAPQVAKAAPGATQHTQDLGRDVALGPDHVPHGVVHVVGYVDLPALAAPVVEILFVFEPLPGGDPFGIGAQDQHSLHDVMP